MKTTNCFLTFSSLSPARVRWIGVIALGVVLASVSPAYGKQLSWSGASPSSGNWSDVANWGYIGVPLNGDTLIFPAGQPRTTNTNNISGLTLNQICFSGSAGGYYIFGLGITLTNNIQATNTAGTNEIFNYITLATTDVIVNVDGAAGLNLVGALSGSVGLTKVGGGTLNYGCYNGANSYTGTTRVNAGTLTLRVNTDNGAFGGPLVIGDGSGSGSPTVRLLYDTSIPDTVPITVNLGGLLDLNGLFDTIGSLAGSGNVSLGSGGNLSVGGDNTSTTFSGIISGAGTFTKPGAGMLTLTGPNTYTGATTVSGGALWVNGSQPQSAVTVSNGATLGGSGTVGHINVVGGIVAPGTGMLTSSNITLDASSSFVVELHGTTAGSGYGQVNARGTVSLGNAALNASLTFPSAISNTFTIINNDGSDAVSGTFAGLAEGATLVIGGAQFRISYAGGSGNDVVLTRLTEPPRPQLTIAPASTGSVRLLWPTNPAGFNLEASTNLSTNIWSDILPAPLVTGTNNVVTNAMDTPRKFYRLRKP